MPELSIRLKSGQLSRLGFRAVDVLDGIQNAYQGTVAAQVFEGNRTYDIQVILAPQVRASIDQIGSLLLHNLGGQAVPLHELAAISQVSGRYQITHDGGAICRRCWSTSADDP